MGFTCKTCWEFNNDESLVSCKKCGTPRAVAAKPAAPKAEGMIFKFEAVTGNCPFKSSGLQKLTGQFTLNYSSPKDVAGTGYDDVCPCQKHVNPDIIDGKVKLFKESDGKTPSVPVFFNSVSKKLTILGDGHHTFCAALKSATPVILYLFEAKAYNSLGHRDWKSCTYEKFDTQAAAKTGSKFT